MKTPTIESDGSISEIEGADRKNGMYHQLARKRKDYELSVTREPKEDESAYEMVVYRWQSLFFEIDDTRVAFVWVLVDNDFMREVKDLHGRNLIINKHVNKYAPWLFTYGERVKNESTKTPG